MMFKHHNSLRASMLGYLLWTALVWLASAQDLSSLLNGLQPDCKTNVITSSAGLAGCAQLIQLLQIASAPANESIVQPLEQYIKSIQDQECSKSDLEAAQKALQDHCQADMQKPPVLVLNETVENYPAIRELLLLKEQNWTDRWCVTDILSQAEDASGTKFSRQNLLNLLGGNAQAFMAMLSKLPTKVYCNDCGKGLIAKTVVLVNKTNPQAVGPMQEGADSKCGNNFTDTSGKLPPSIKTADNSGASISSFISASLLLLLLACSALITL